MITGLRRCKKRPSFNLPSNCIMIRNFCQAVLRRVFQFFQEFFYFPLFSAEVSFFRALPPENTDRVPPFRLLSALLPPFLGLPFPFREKTGLPRARTTFPEADFFPADGRGSAENSLPPFSLCAVFRPGLSPAPFFSRPDALARRRDFCAPPLFLFARIRTIFLSARGRFCLYRLTFLELLTFSQFYAILYSIICHSSR